VTLEALVGEKRWELYRALAEPVRLRILALVAQEELTVGELAELLGESQPNASRHVAALRQARLVTVRRQGTRALVAARPTDDPVVGDAIRSGRALCETDGSFERLADVFEARDRASREYFDKARARDGFGPPPELAAYLAALGTLIERRSLAVDAGTGDGSLLEVLAHVFERVVAVDRSEAQLTVARARAKARGLRNVILVKGELGANEVREAVGKRGADVVFAARLLHHAARPPDVVRALAALAAPAGAVVVIDYARHDDEGMREHADVWLGFEPDELRAFARAARLKYVQITPIPAPARGASPDSHLPWQVMIARKEEEHG
jgi:ArsR family transcriptional regulator